MKEIDMGGTCNTYGINGKGTNSFENIGVGRRII
jgi:hypothetical protein